MKEVERQVKRDKEEERERFRKLEWGRE